jgi:ribosome biogenesis GTPase
VTRRSARLDEDDVRVRPGRSKSRPRSKDRPSFDDARDAMVITVDRGRFTVDTGGQEEFAVKARDLGRKGLVVGDRVAVSGDAPGTLDHPVRVVTRYERASELRRTADDSDPIERVIVANADQLAIVTATTNPEPSIGLIDRSLVAAMDAGIPAIIIVTKIDLGSPAPIQEAYSPLSIPVFAVPKGVPTPELVTALTGRETVLIGHSGVGKSTLVNALVPDAARRIGSVNVSTGKGRHTSTSVRAFPYALGGHIIDTPGIRSFGLAHVDPQNLVLAFPDLAARIVDCPRSCSHDEVECALTPLLEDPNLGPRVASLHRLLRSRALPTDAISPTR